MEKEREEGAKGAVKARRGKRRRAGGMKRAVYDSGRRWPQWDVAEIGRSTQPIAGWDLQREAPSVDTPWQGQSLGEPQLRIRVVSSAPLHHLRWPIFRTAPADPIAQSTRETSTDHGNLVMVSLVNT